MNQQEIKGQLEKLDIESRSALNRLVKAAEICQSYAHFEKIILDNPQWFLCTESMKKWTKTTLENFYRLKLDKSLARGK
jgi:hypothetical protein